MITRVVENPIASGETTVRVMGTHEVRSSKATQMTNVQGTVPVVDSRSLGMKILDITIYALYTLLLAAEFVGVGFYISLLTETGYGWQACLCSFLLWICSMAVDYCYKQKGLQLWRALFVVERIYHELVLMNLALALLGILMFYGTYVFF